MASYDGATSLKENIQANSSTTAPSQVSWSGARAASSSGPVASQTGPEHRIGIAGATLTFVAKSSVGAPLLGLSPTWVTYKNAVTNGVQTAPTVTAVGGGNYKFVFSGTSPAGILDLGETASPRYIVFSALSEAWVFAVFSAIGAPLTGIVPVWDHLRYVVDGTNYTPQPGITELGAGLYKTVYLSTRVTGILNLGATAAPQYLKYDSDRPILLIPIHEG